jgi:DNA-binding NtrC family response regulator
MTEELLNFVNALASPIQVCVIDSEEEVGYQIEDALAVYNCNVSLHYDPKVECSCLQMEKGCSADLVFIADNVENCQDVIRYIEREQPEASIVILTRNPSGSKVAEIMCSGVYTFLTKNGSFTSKNVKSIFQQLNLRLHASDPAGPGDVVKTEVQPS